MKRELAAKSIGDVVATSLCCGCGVCAYMDSGACVMVDIPNQGRRPLPTSSHEEHAREALAVCPGIALSHELDSNARGLVRELSYAWGPILDLYEGYAHDEQIRFSASSGGAASALSLYAIEVGGMHGVLHTAARNDIPYLNRTVMSRSRKEVWARTGSRYAPASPCEGLQEIEDAPAPCVFVGKPCDVAAANAAGALRPALQAKLGLTIAVFCAGTPSTEGTLQMLKRMGIDDPASLVSLRYRGNGWPGKATAVFRMADGREETRELTYEQSWGEVLTKHVQWRCRLCPDHTGEFADISVGDPWHKPPGEDEPGRSLIVVRTMRGRDMMRAAIAAGYLAAERVEPAVLPASQMNLLRVRAAVWGRIWACRLLGIPVPRFRNLPQFRFWCSVLTLREKLQSFVGTAKRILRRRLWRRVVLKLSGSAIDPR